MADSLKRKMRPIQEELDDTPEPPASKRRLNLSEIKRKYIPSGTLIASENSVVTALALPSKGKKYVQFDISPDGEASRMDVVTEQTFVESNTTVDRMDVRASLAANGTIDPSRLSKNTSNVKSLRDAPPLEEPKEDAMEVTQETPTEETSKVPKEKEPLVLSDYEEEEEEGEKPKEEVKETTDVTLNVEEASAPAQMEAESTEEKQMKMKETIQETIVKESLGESTIEQPKKADTPLSEIGILENYTNTLYAAMQTETDPAIRRQQFEELRSLTRDIKNIKAQDKMALGVARVEVQEAVTTDREREQIEEDTLEKQQRLAVAKESPDNKLAKGQTANVEEMDIASGAHMDVEMEDQVDKTESDAADPTKQDAKDVNDIPPIVDVDTKMSDVNQETDRTTMGSDRYVDVVEQHRSQVSSVAASANATAVAISDMEVLTEKELKEETLRIEKAAKAEAIAEKKRLKEEERVQKEQDKINAMEVVTPGELRTESAEMKREESARLAAQKKIEDEELGQMRSEEQQTKQLIRTEKAQEKARQADEQSMMIAEEKHTKRLMKLEKAQEGAELKRMKAEEKGQIKQMKAAERERIRLEKEEQRVIDEYNTRRQKEVEFQQDLQDAGIDIPGVTGILADLESRGLIEDVEDLAMVRKVVASLRETNKVTDVRTAAAPTPEDLIQSTIAVGQLGIPGVMGSSQVGTPVFVPGTARDDLHALMNGVITITEAESVELKAQMTPLWNEFKLGRLAAGVREMERMPTRLVISPTSSIQNASKIRADETQQNITFGNFMSWLLHKRLDGTKMQTWRGMLLYSAALGYNNLTQAQVNWIITGNENGDLDSNTDFSNLNWEEGDPLDQQLEVKGHVLKPSMIKSLFAQLEGNPEPRTPYPSSNTSPSAAPIDDSIHPDNSTGPQRANRATFKGLPTSISNIPDPRFSQRGNETVPNIRIMTIKNPDFDPTKSPDDPEYEPEFTTTPVDDLGVGAKEIGAHIEAAVSDRLLRSMPSKLYAPIHAQACDRYLGSINYQRLSLSLEKYMKSYSQHPWGPEDFQQMYDWNSYTMALYGTMLYAFVTDIKMQRITPIFDMSTPTAVGDEYMELNELISELSRYQQVSEDRAGRVGDDGSSKRPVEDHIDQYMDEKTDREKMMIQDSNVVAISVPVTEFPGAQVEPTPLVKPPTGFNFTSQTPPATTAPPSSFQFGIGSENPPDFPQTSSTTSPFTSFTTAPPPLSTNTPIQSGLDTGVRRSPNTSARNPAVQQEDELAQRHRMFQMFQRS